MFYECTEAGREGVRTILRIRLDGSTREAFAPLALTPYRNSSKRLRRWPNVVSFSASNGMRRGRIPPELEGKTRNFPDYRIYAFPTPSLLADVLPTQQDQKKWGGKTKKTRNLTQTGEWGWKLQVISRLLQHLSQETVSIIPWGIACAQSNLRHPNSTAPATLPPGKHLPGLQFLSSDVLRVEMSVRSDYTGLWVNRVYIGPFALRLQDAGVPRNQSIVRG